jgi:16S rRNA (guanine527-N7)-methyltransferase
LELVKKYFDHLSDEQEQQLMQLGDLYPFWNDQINVISRKDIDKLYLHHVLHSLAIAKFIHFADKTAVLDVGCGGGFPGIPLAIMFPQVQFTLLDSIGKKIKVVNEVAKALHLHNVEGVNMRAEKMDRKFDFITSRAVTAFPSFVNTTRKLISKQSKNQIDNGIIYLKGGDFADEIVRFKDKIRIVPIRTYFAEPFFDTKKIIYLPL